MRHACSACDADAHHLLCILCFHFPPQAQDDVPNGAAVMWYAMLTPNPRTPLHRLLAFDTPGPTAPLSNSMTISGAPGRGRPTASSVGVCLAYGLVCTAALHLSSSPAHFPVCHAAKQAWGVAQTSGCFKLQLCFVAFLVAPLACVCAPCVLTTRCVVLLLLYVFELVYCYERPAFWL